MALGSSCGNPGKVVVKAFSVSRSGVPICETSFLVTGGTSLARGWIPHSVVPRVIHVVTDCHDIRDVCEGCPFVRKWRVNPVWVSRPYYQTRGANIGRVGEVRAVPCDSNGRLALFRGYCVELSVHIIVHIRGKGVLPKVPVSQVK